MPNQWIIYAGITVVYIVILVIYFTRRSKRHEQELSNFLKTARTQLETHKQESTKDVQLKVKKAALIVKQVQKAAKKFEEEAYQEYQQIIKDAKQERSDLLAEAKAEIEELFEEAEDDLEHYRQKRYQEIENNLVKLVIAVTEKVVQTSLTEKEHHDIIYQALDEIKHQKSRN